ncbi:MAG: TRAP transporter large permease subunit [Gammaproteobacteria bacterium]|nr:TRAP transporter large permease subunit [Gammaproteobacteria bacterium]
MFAYEFAPEILAEFMPLVMFLGVCLVLASGYPVAFGLAGAALGFAGLGIWLDWYYGMEFFDDSLLTAPGRFYGILDNQTLMAVPLFVFMGVMLERARIAESLLENMAALFGTRRGGLGYSVCLVGMLLAASTGIVGATVVTMGLLSLPTMLKRGYDPRFATGVICASGTLGQIIPPSIVLVLLADQLGSAYQQAQASMGITNPDALSVGDLFVGAIIPGLTLVVGYLLYVAWLAWRHPAAVPALPEDRSISHGQALRRALTSLAMPLGLIVAVLGSILAGIATPTEAASVGALGAMLLAIAQGEFTLSRLKEVMEGTLHNTAMVFMILFGASIFSLVFRAYGGDELVHHLFDRMPGGAVGAMAVVMGVMFLLGFILDFIEITFVVVPIVAPVLLKMGLDPIWLGVMMGVNLQTSFLTPPFGFALFYLRGVAPASISTGQIYRGVMPFIGIQVAMLAILALWPELATWLPRVVYGD